MEPLHVTEWGAGETVVLVHGTRSWGTRSFEAQKPLGRLGYRLLIVDRRGFGRSPDTAREDFERDAHDIGELLDERAHLVAHSYGAVGALLSVAERREAVRSLALIEPATFSLARGRPEVERFVEEVEDFYAAPTWTTPEEFVAASARAVGEEPETRALTSDERRAISTAMTGRHVWEAHIPADALREPPFRSLVVTGARRPSSPRAEMVRDSFLAAADATAELLGAEHVRVEDADHSPHSERPDVVNAALVRLWGQSRP